MARDNLRDALHYLRRPSEIRRLWIDAVSIDQTNVRERAKQVQMMGLIYWHANRVIVWLGLDDNPEVPASGAFDLIRETSNIAWDSLQKHNNDFKAVPQVNVTDLSRYDFQRWSLLAKFFESRPWFGRGWTIQELGLARDAVLTCGRAELCLDVYLPFVRWIDQKGQLLHSKFDIRLNPQYVATEYWLSTRTPDDIVHLSFLEVLERTREVNCTDQRDYVYAFLGHPSAFEAYPGDPTPYVDYRSNYFTSDRKSIIEPNYEKSTADVYTELARALMLHYGDLSVLSCVHRSTKELRESGLEKPQQSSNSADSLQDSHLPSWVPRWDLPHMPTLGLGYYYTATKDSAPSFQFHKKCLKLRGQEIDTIVWAKSIWSGFFNGFYHPSSMTTDVENRLEALWNTYRFYLWYLKLGVKADRATFLFTLTAGLIAGEPAEDEDRAPQFMRNAAAYELQACNALGTPIKDERRATLEKEALGGDPSRFLLDVERISDGRVLFLTKTGKLGSGLPTAKIGDKVFLLEGADVPFALRSAKKKPSWYKIVGEVYMHGIMRGEAYMEEGLQEITLF
ncbi:hypothetical protein K505DRAFT_322820 [Melanomma pulvis-pyrius CBS 109.77]|uniref:Heterokaryon incompatibility domain-containing protein n=1 Tax=Melanomma pulvis-pyrius CBS 109.77 TaxID=1314802 RepID=A0A6A6XNH4_9PLEO|nr:hypothetical protein K505DRAFT_322820 [Melanomma pulvis-pyrius CBS 109.77]